MSKKKILIVEDEALPAKCLHDMLIKHNFTVIGVVDNADDAIKKTRLLEPDLILMDIMLKGPKTGCDAAKEIRKFSDTLIIVLTACDDEEILNCVIEIEPDNFLMKSRYEALDKPYRESQIITVVKIAFEHQKVLSNEHKSCESDDNIIHLKCGYIYDKEQKRLTKHGYEIDLGDKGHPLVDLLCANINNSVSNEQICNAIYQEEVNPKTIRSLVCRVRDKTCKEFIKNNSSFGYRIESFCKLWHKI
jgi:DNA-binding response OmpR family regulator